MGIAPRFKHDCAECKFLGYVDGCDAYTCEETVILRSGDDGPEYSSLPISVIGLLPDASPYKVALRLK